MRLILSHPGKLLDQLCLELVNLRLKNANATALFDALIPDSESLASGNTFLRTNYRCTSEMKEVFRSTTSVNGQGLFRNAKGKDGKALQAAT